MRDLHDLVRLATRQQGHFNNRQADRLGVGRTRLSRLCEVGVIGRVHRGVYRMAGAGSGFEQQVAAACLAAPLLAVASHRSALRLWGLRSVDDLVEVTIDRGTTLRLDGVRVHRSLDLEPRDVSRVGGIPVTSPVRTLCDSGAVFPPHEVSRQVDHALATGLVALADLACFRRRVGRQGRNGVGVLARVLDELPIGAARAESGPEVALLRLLADHGLPMPALQLPVRVRGRIYRPDLAYPAAMVAIEYDGHAVHSAADRFVADRRRQNHLVLAGWTVLRFSWPDIRERPRSVVRAVEAALSAFGRD